MPVPITAEHDASLSIEPVFELGTMNEWWRLTADHPSFRQHSHTLLKEYGYMRLMDLLERVRPTRALEFGHGFNPTLLAYGQSRCEMHGIDDDQHLQYFPSGEEWDNLYRDCIANACPQSHLHRGLLGEPERHALEAGSFGLIASVSVLEELPQDVLTKVVSDAARLLEPGGLLAGTFDVMVTRLDALDVFSSICEQAGLRVGAPPAAPSAEEWNNLLLESPSCVMCTYQMGQPEDRSFSGHWSAAWFIAEKIG